MHVMTTAMVSETSNQPLTATNATGGCSQVDDDETMETDVLMSSTGDGVSASVDGVAAQGQPNLPSSNDSGWLSQVLNQLWCQLGFSDVNNSGGDVRDKGSSETVGVSTGDNVVNHLMSNNDVMLVQNISRDSGQTSSDNYCCLRGPTLLSANNFTLDCNRQTVMSSYASEQFSKTLFDDLGEPGSALYADTASASVSGERDNNSYDFKSLASMSDDDFDIFDERFFTNDSLNDVMEFPVSQFTENEENEATIMLEKWFAENLDSLFVEQLSSGSLTGNEGTNSTCSDLTSTAERFLSSSPHWLETGSIYSSETNTSSSQLSRQSSFCSTISGSQPDDECAVMAGNTSSISAANGANPSGNFSSLRSSGKAVKEPTTVRHASVGSPRDWHRYHLRRSSSNVSRRRKVSGSGQEGSSRSSTPGSSSDLPLLSNRSPHEFGQSTARADRPLSRHYSFGSSGYDSVGPRTPDEDFDELSTCKYGDSEFLRLLLDQKGPKTDSSDGNQCKSTVDDDSDSGLGRSRRFENRCNDGAPSYAGPLSLCSKQHSRRSGCHPVISLVPAIPLNGLPTTNELDVKRRTMQASLPGLIGKAGNGFSSRRRVLEDHCYFVRALQSDPVGVIRTGMSKRKRRSSAPEDQSARLQGLKVSPMLSVLLNAQQSRKTRTKSQVSGGDERSDDTSSPACHSYLELFLRSTGPLSANQGSDLIVSEKLGQLRAGVSNRAREPAPLSRSTTSGKRVPHCQTSTHRSASKSGKDVVLSDVGAERPAASSQPRLLHRLLTEDTTRDETNVCLTADDAIDYQFDSPRSDYQQMLDDNNTIGIYGDVIASPCAGNVDPLPGVFDGIQMESMDDTSRTDSDWWATCLGYCP